MRSVGVLLCGCGVYDGSDAQETVLLLLALERNRLRPVPIAPDIEQREVVDHTSGDAVPGADPRRVMIESARLARGAMQPLSEIPPATLDALVVPGGMGVVKNLCTEGSGPLGVGELRPEIAAFLEELQTRRIPLAFVGLARVVLDRLFGDPLPSAALSVAAGEIVVDEERKTLFTPGFMGGDSLSAVAAGIDRLAEELARRLGGPSLLSIRSASR